MKVKFTKVSGILAPFGPDAEAWMSATKAGQVIEVDATRVRNWKFLKKYFALLNYAFTQWDIPENDAAKNFDEFRGDLAILAGYYDMVVRVDGSERPRAKSIAFDKMEEDEFERLYSKTLDILLAKILPSHTEEEINQIMGFM